MLSPLPLQYVANIVETFVKAKKDIDITKNMITIASDRLTRAPATEVTLKASLTQLLSLLGDMIKSHEDIDSKVVALDCVGKLSRIYGKTELSLFEDLAAAIVVNGTTNDDDIVIERTFDCLLCMLYITSLLLKLILVRFLVPELSLCCQISCMSCLNNLSALMVLN